MASGLLKCAALVLLSVLSIASLTGCAERIGQQAGGDPPTGDTPKNPTSRPADPADRNSTVPAEVVIDNFSFKPAVVTVSVGSQVTWINRDDTPHTVTENNKQFGSRAMDTDDRFTYTFSSRGTYKYFCSVHPKMTGQVIVQ